MGSADGGGAASLGAAGGLGGDCFGAAGKIPTITGTGSGGGGDGAGPRGLGIAAPSGRGRGRNDEDRALVEPRAPRPFRPERIRQPEPRPDPDDNGDLAEIRKAIRDQSALTGPFADITNLLRKGNKQPALQAAMDWRTKAPTDVLALVALGLARGGAAR